MHWNEFKEYLAYRIYQQWTQFVHVDTGLVIVSACSMIATLPKVREVLEVPI